jgi:hypothetical protein
MAGPGDNTAAAAGGGDGHLRASRADREQAIELLKAAFVEDRLTKEELDARVGQALMSRTYTDLAAVTADIPAGLIARQPPREPARAQKRPPMSNAAKAGISVAAAAAVPTLLTFVIGPLAIMMFLPFYFMALLVAGAQILFSRYEERSRRQLPPRPAQGGQAPEGQQPGPLGHRSRQALLDEGEGELFQATPGGLGDVAQRPRPGQHGQPVHRGPDGELGAVATPPVQHARVDQLVERGAELIQRHALLPRPAV